MTRKVTRLLAVTLTACLIAVGCGNSDGSSSDTTAASGGAGEGGEETRDEFVALSGVPGVTDDEIAYDVVGTKTGNPLGTCILDCFVEGFED